MLALTLIIFGTVVNRLTKEAALSGERRRHRGHRTRSPFRDAVSVVLSIVLMVALLGTTATVITRFAVLSDAGILSALNGEYYDYTLSNVSAQTSTYAKSVGVDDSVLDGVFTMERLKADTEGYVNAGLEGDAYELNTADERNLLTVNLRNASVSEDAASSFVDGVLDVYVSTIRLDNLDAFVQKRDALMQMFPVALVALVAIAALCIYGLMKLHHFPHRSWRYVAYATGAAAVVSFFACGILLATGFYKQMDLSPQQYAHFVSAVIAHGLMLCMALSALYAAVTAVLALVIRRMRADAVQRRNIHYQE